MTKAEH